MHQPRIILPILSKLMLSFSKNKGNEIGVSDSLGCALSDIIAKL